MTRKITVLCVATALCLGTAMSVSATTCKKDPKAFTDAYIDYVVGDDEKVKGKAYARTGNANMKKISVFGTFYQGNVKKEQGSNSTTTHNETAWYTREYDSSGSYSLNSVSRTYYKDGTESCQSSMKNFSWH
ncbi:hypothetical protein [Paenibacillus popilliae]|uniref:Large exoprotein n=1 Tax=Paenibacillus popilliae ATCC 14706 TaxID=1212764 RepID=M9LGP4_PAEPP|nr:hypothetical protein [Paenibacillus popilliae]GAC41765.1 large exoprotein [Paenibacillus popilliae ATCC 14706]